MSRSGRDIAELFSGLTVTGESPDGRIWARIENFTELRLGFHPFTYDSYDETSVAAQLSRLGLLMWVAYARERTAVHRRFHNLSAEESRAGERSDDQRVRRYGEELNALPGRGISAMGTVRIDTVGMLQWQIQVEPGTIRRLAESSFVAEAASAFESLKTDRANKIALLKADHFDLGLPASWRDLAAEVRDLNRRAGHR